MSRKKSSPMGCAILAIVGVWLSSKCGSTPVPSPTPRPVYQRSPTPQEIAAEKAQMKAMEAKARREEAEAKAYQKQMQERAEDQVAEERLNALRGQQGQLATQRYYQDNPQSRVTRTDGTTFPDWNAGTSRDSAGASYPSGTQVGPRGGTFHYTKSGKKDYHKR